MEPIEFIISLPLNKIFFYFCISCNLQYKNDDKTKLNSFYCFHNTIEIKKIMQKNFIFFNFINFIFIKIKIKMQEKQKQKYASVYSFINLPPLIKFQQSIFQKANLTEEERSIISQSIEKDRNQMIDTINSQTYIFDDPKNYQFKFPQSKFSPPLAGKTNLVSFEKQVVVQEQDTFENRLNSAQIKQISQNGQFEVKSKYFGATIPYIWKINGCLFRGSLNRAKAWQDGLGRCYRLMCFALEVLKQVVPHSLEKLIEMPLRLFSIIFGKKKLRLFYNPNYQREVVKDFWGSIFQNELKDIKKQVGHQFLDMLYLQYDNAMYRTKKQNHQIEINSREEKVKIYNEKKNEVAKIRSKVRRVEEKFEENWQKIRKNILAKIITQVEQEKSHGAIQNDEQPLRSEAKIQSDEEKILNKFYEEKYSIYTAHLKQNLPKEDFSNKTIQALLHLMVIVQTIEYKTSKKQKKLAEIQEKIRQRITKQNPIRSQRYEFIQGRLKEQYDPIRNQMQNQFYLTLLNDQNLSSVLSQNYRSIYFKYLNLKKNFNQLVEKKKETLKLFYEPQRVFRTTYILLPPYDVLYQNGYYNLKKKEQLKCDTGTYFWKCKLYGMRLKSWTLNCFKFMIGMCWASPLGIRCLVGIQNFAYGQQCDNRTGAKRQITRPPLLGVFKKVLRGIKKSRANFQSLPDRGLFGKNLGRVCNVVQCYLFRFFIVGVIGVLMLYPVAIICFSALCFVGVLTSWVWVPLCMLITYLFNILVFQFEMNRYPEGCLIKSIPLLSLGILIAFHLIKISLSFLFLVCFAPLLCLVYIILLILQRIGRTITDYLMLCMISCCGRTPSRDTSMAKKIAGPGMSRTYFFSIAQEDVYVLTQCALENIFLEKYSNITRSLIQKNLSKYEKIFNFLLKPFGHSRPIYKKQDLIWKNTQQLLNSFNAQLNTHSQRYPRYPRNVRFTQEQLQQYFPNSIKIVKNFIEKEKMGPWIFQEKRVLFEDYEELTRVIWISIFNCGEEIFQPLQNIDKRFQLVQDEENEGKMRSNVQSVMNALEGQVELTHKKADFTPAKRSLLAKDTSRMNYLSRICSIHERNSDINLIVSLQDPCMILVPQRNIKELIEYDIYQREHSKEGKYKVIEQ